MRRRERAAQGAQARLGQADGGQGQGERGAVEPLDEPDARGPPGRDDVRVLERELPQAHDVRPERADHRVDAAQGDVVRGDDQQPEQVDGARHAVDARRPADLHHLRGRDGDRRLGRRQPAVGEGAQDAARPRVLVARRPEHPVLHARLRGPRVRREWHLHRAAPPRRPRLGGGADLAHRHRLVRRRAAQFGGAQFGGAQFFGAIFSRPIHHHRLHTGTTAPRGCRTPTSRRSRSVWKTAGCS